MYTTPFELSLAQQGWESQGCNDDIFDTWESDSLWHNIRRAVANEGEVCEELYHKEVKGAFEVS
jgi:hypothetical protein